ncbi:MAG TPA: HD domain-containing phosphohydrolase, partial [Solirubrobacterales bacterium]|nr:HD domain-containing phosphohydrolase [Solirubrobacterales bacterium]
ERILIVDDEAQMRRMLSRVLASRGYRCKGAEGASEGRVLLKRESFDLAICDLRISEEGMTLLDEIERAHSEMALLMASDDPSLAHIAGEHGVSGYLIKPLRDSEVLVSVACALGQAERQRRQRSVGDRFGRQTEMLERLSKVIARRDLKTGIHTRRVGEYSAFLARACGLGEEEVQSIRQAAPMHDIGKLAIPDAILLKPGPLSSAESRFMQRHAQIGHDLLAGAGSPLLDLAAEIALTHHENFDGNGYPHGLRGFEIPIAGRIVAIADVFDALISDRPYRKAVSPQRAVATMIVGRGARFDPSLLDFFTENLDSILEGLGPRSASSRMAAPSQSVD